MKPMQLNLFEKFVEKPSKAEIETMAEIFNFRLSGNHDKNIAKAKAAVRERFKQCQQAQKAGQFIPVGMYFMDIMGFYFSYCDERTPF